MTDDQLTAAAVGTIEVLTVLLLYTKRPITYNNVVMYRLVSYFRRHVKSLSGGKTFFDVTNTSLTAPYRQLSRPINGDRLCLWEPLIFDPPQSRSPINL